MAIVVQPPKIMKATDQLVRRFQDMPRHAQERPLKEERVKYLKNEIDAGRFHSPVWAEVYCKSNNITYRVNGQHTSFLLSTIDEVNRPDVFLERFEVDSPAEVSMVFSTYDNKASARTVSDITRAGFALNDFLDEEGGRKISIRLATTVTAGVYLADQATLEWECGERRVGTQRSKALSTSDRVSRCVREVDFIRFTHGFNTNAERGNFIRSPVIAAMFLTYKVDAVAASTFWSAVRDGTGEVGSPSRLLRDFLLTKNLGTGSRQMASMREMLAKCIQAWNYFRTGSTLSRLSHKETSLIPKAL